MKKIRLSTGKEFFVDIYECLCELDMVVHGCTLKYLLTEEEIKELRFKLMSKKGAE